MNNAFLIMPLSLVLLVSACTGDYSSDSCEDLVGTLTHADVFIDGISAVTVSERVPGTGALAAVDQFDGTAFSNLVVELELSATEQQYTFAAKADFRPSGLEWLMSSAHACTLMPYYENHDPQVSRIEVFSDSDFNAEHVAGSDLSALFDVSYETANGVLQDITAVDGMPSSTYYRLQAARENDALSAIPATPALHVLTLLVSLSNGETYTIRTPEFLLSGV